MNNYDEYENLLSEGPAQADSAAQFMSDTDIGGDFLFGYGDASRNKKIRERQGKLRALEGKITRAQRERLEAAIASTSGEWDALTKEILGADGNKLSDFYKGIQGEESAALGDLETSLGKYKSQEDLFSDPNFYGDVGDVENYAKPTDATVQEQRGFLAKMKALSDPQESAQERFMRLMAQREADANMKGARDTLAQDLKARGVYGSGAEVVQNMMSQASEGNRRYMANLAANAQAQQRAADMLGKGSALAGQMRGSETQEGLFKTQADMFNNAHNQATSNARAGLQLQSRGADNQAERSKGATLYDAKMGQTGRVRGDDREVRGAKTGLTSGKIKNIWTGQNMLNESDDQYRAGIQGRIAQEESDIENDALLGGGMG